MQSIIADNLGCPLALAANMEWGLFKRKVRKKHDFSIRTTVLILNLTS